MEVAILTLLECTTKFFYNKGFYTISSFTTLDTENLNKITTFGLGKIFVEPLCALLLAAFRNAGAQ